MTRNVVPEAGVAGERLRVGTDAIFGRKIGADIDHCTPFGEPRTETAIFGEPFAETVQSFRDHFAGMKRQRLEALVDLDAGKRPGLLDHLDQRRSVLGFLPDGLVEQDHAGNVVLHRLGRTEQQLAVIAAAVGRRLDADLFETLLNRTR